MIDEELLAELEVAVREVGGIHSLSEGEAAACVNELANVFVTDSKCQWWWESLKKPSKHIAYESNDGLAILATLIEQESPVVLVVTDDSLPPWPVYLGSMEGVIAVLRECRFFEFFLAAPDGSWMVFDTHMNELVVTGRLV